MIKVITYGTFDLLHYGHIRLLERAKELGDYLIVGVTADDFDMMRGKINVQQSLMERVEAVRATGIADEIIIEEYEGQKIDDIRKYDIDIFTVGSDWVGKFDYLNEYCKVVYLDRTQGISSTEIRKEKREIRLGLVGDATFLNKIYRECKYVNGIKITALLTNKIGSMNQGLREYAISNFDNLLDITDAVYIRSYPDFHYKQIKQALEKGVHVLCESPIALNEVQTKELLWLAKKNNVILMEAIKTAYATAFSRLLLLLKGGKIGEVVAVDATCTSLKKDNTDWPGFFEWGPTAMLPIFEILDGDFSTKIIKHLDENGIDYFTKIDFIFEHAVASIKVGNGVKSEGQLIVSGTKGYVYVPAPWWKTDYFEIRYENQNENQRYFYQLEGEGIRQELVAFIKSISLLKEVSNIKPKTTVEIARICNDYITGRNVVNI